MELFKNPMNRSDRWFFRLIACLCALATLIAAADAQVSPPVWSNTSKYVPGDMVTDYGNVYRCIKAVTTPYLDPSKTYTNWELNEVRNNTTLTIGTDQTFPTLTAAWTNAINCRVAQGVYLHLAIVTSKGDFSESFTSPFSLDHGAAAGISIIGDQVANINLAFSSSAGFTIDSGCTFGTLENFTLTQTSKDGQRGIALSQNSTIALVSNISFAGSDFPIYADTGSCVTGGSGLQFSGFYGAVITATNGATAAADGLTIEGTTSGQKTGVSGIVAEFGGHVIAHSAVISNLENAVEAIEAGVADISSSNISQCEYGVWAVMRGHVYAASVNLINDQYGDFWADTGATVDATSANYSGNGAHPANAGYIFTQSQ